jgi:hypothetical protein
MESFRVLGLEAIEPAYGQFEGSMYAGLLPVSHVQSKDRTVDGNMMFWLFEPETQEVEKTLVMWLNGGPGCSVRSCVGVTAQSAWNAGVSDDWGDSRLSP